jgi:hypothetical protein
MSVAQLSLLPDVLPDNDVEPMVKRPSVPVAKRINGRWCWMVFGSSEYRHEPELEQILLAALTKQQQRKAA